MSLFSRPNHLFWRTFGAQGHEKTPQSMKGYGKSEPAKH